MAVSNGAVRFRKIAEQVSGITDRMLSKELKELEINSLIERAVLPTFPPTVEYSLTNHGRTLDKVIAELPAWGMVHRKVVTDR